MNQISNLSRKQRTYEGIWRALRSPPHMVTLEIIDPLLVPRIKRMISKEKDMDTGFKLLNGQEWLFLEFSWCAEKLELQVVLKSRFGLVEVRG